MTARARVPLALAALVSLAGCGTEPARAPAAAAGAATDSGAARALSVPDSLALRAPGGAEVWFVGGREARDSAGTPCRERLLEVREGAARHPVPLLYTGETPALVNDSTVHAHIWLHCRPGNLYSVSLRTGWPTRVMP